MPQKQSDRITNLEKFQYEFSAKITEQITNISTSLVEIKNLFGEFVRESKQIYATKEELNFIRRDLQKDFNSSKKFSWFMLGGIGFPLIVVIISKFIK